MDCCSCDTKLWKSSIARKFVMGLTGLALCGFVFVHMSGNMLIFKSAEAYNMYGHGITGNPLYPLISWGLIGVVILHVLCAVSLTWENQRARDVAYAMPTNNEKAASLASRSMAATGSIIAVFLVLHLLGFKYGAYYEVTYGDHTVRDLHKLILEVFRNPVYVVWYVFALIPLGFHLSHGFSSAFQSLGFSHPKWSPLIKTLACIYAIVVAAGFMSQPLYVFFFAR